MQRDAMQAEHAPAKVLIVDDDEVIATALYRHLIGQGVSVDLAHDADGGKALLANQTYALVVVDAYLTGQLHSRALQFIATVREMQRSGQILVLTAYSSPALAAMVAADERITLVRKPQSIRNLAELIEGFVHKRSNP